MTRYSLTHHDLLKLGLFPFLVFMINYALILILPEAGREYQADTVLHLLGGLSIAYSANHVLELAGRAKRLTVQSRLLKAFIIIGFTVTAAVLWEFYEFVWDEIFGTLFQPSKTDTIKDLFMGLLGASVFCTIFIKNKKRRTGKKRRLPLVILLVVAGCSIAFKQTLAASEPITDTYYRAKVVRIVEEGTVTSTDEGPHPYQRLELEILNGAEKGKRILLDHGKDFVVGNFKLVESGDTVVLDKPTATPDNKEFYYIIDEYRLPSVAFIALIFFGLAIYFGRKRGVTSILGLIFSGVVIFYFVIPHIIQGSPPLLTCLLGAVAIMLVTLYLSHGFNRRTTIALVSTLITLGLAVLIDIAFVSLAKLSGTGTEEAFYLQFNTLALNLKGLLLGGILIGVLGVLDDVTTGQAAVIEEIQAANPALNFTELYRRGLSVGREHIASLVNTLFLAYVGASFPLLLLYSSQQYYSLWMVLNSNFIVEEMVRTLVGSTVLVIAVPLTTVLAAYFFSHKGVIARNPQGRRGNPLA